MCKHIWGSYDDVLYKSTYTLLYFTLIESRTAIVINLLKASETEERQSVNVKATPNTELNWTISRFLTSAASGFSFSIYGTHVHNVTNFLSRLSPQENLVCHSDRERDYCNKCERFRCSMYHTRQNGPIGAVQTCALKKLLAKRYFMNFNVEIEKNHSFLSARNLERSIWLVPPVSGCLWPRSV